MFKSMRTQEKIAIFKSHKYKKLTQKTLSSNKYTFVDTKEKRSLLRPFIIFILAIGVLLYVMDVASYQMSHFHRPFREEETANHRRGDKWDSIDDDAYKHIPYFIATTGCRMPSFNVIDEQVAEFMKHESQPDCGWPLVRSNDSSLWIDSNQTAINSTYNITSIEILRCTCREFRRKTDYENEVADSAIALRFGDVVRISDEFVQVLCFVNTTEVYRDYHFFAKNNRRNEAIKNPFSLENKKSNKLTLAKINEKSAKNHAKDFKNNENEGKYYRDKKESANKKPENKPMSVLVIGTDAVSRLNFHRQMDETAQYLLNELNAVELFGYNKVGDNTYPNLIPVLTGMDEVELASTYMPLGNETFDGCPFIWDTFKAKNFSTVFMEDMAWLGLFHYARDGFISPPTDYYLRPIILQMEQDIANHEDSNTFLCLGKRRTYDVFLELAQKILMTERLHFSFLWSISYTHDYFNYPKLIDAALAEFLRTLDLDNEFLILMSDHGIRWGSFRNTYQGMMEERQPFVFFVPPKHFAHRYPQAMLNLDRNRRRLTTPFDLHETLRDLANLETIEDSAIEQRAKELEMPRGLSLFLPVPETRTCQNAAIAPHWCTCHEKAELPVNDTRVTDVARLIVDHMNDLVQPHPQCHRLRLSAILSANLGIAYMSIRNVSDHFEDITVRIRTKPGLGEFEGTIRVYPNDQLKLAGAVSRTNLYAGQSECVQDALLKLYCFCGSVS